jgi:hypothetical protein
MTNVGISKGMTGKELVSSAGIETELVIYCLLMEKRFWPLYVRHNEDGVLDCNKKTIPHPFARQHGNGCTAF